MLQRDRKEDEDLPLLVIGGRDGAIGCYALVVPKYSPRRTDDVVPLIRELFQREMGTAPGGLGAGLFVRAAGHREAYPWLRLCDVRTTNLLRFSIWIELRQAYEGHLQRSGAGPPLPKRALSKAREYGRKLRKLTDEVYGRTPFSLEGASILWSETARYARLLAEGCIEARSTDRQEGLAAYNYLLLQIDHLCNRWIGADDATVATVLSDSFTELFNWASLVLIASASDAEDAPRELDELLLFKAVQRRLRHSNVVVPSATIHAINSAIFRALEKKAQLDAPWEFVHRQPGRPLGFHDLLVLVGELVRQQAGRITPSDPLYTEISKFFALSILLVPAGISSVGQIVSESWLAESSDDVGQRIL
ncbi:MAG TPA: hypothetical protein VN970_05305, partial [Thermoanaerobaculia bacterium]|nr:hypothetical protein [Thermoanaerobaculia bacterium]